MKSRLESRCLSTIQACACCTMCLLLSSANRAQAQAEFHPLIADAGTGIALVRGVSGDGQVVLGAIWHLPAFMPVPSRWPNPDLPAQVAPFNELPGFSSADAHQSSTDGTTIIGSGVTVDFETRAFLWRAGFGIEWLPGLIKEPGVYTIGTCVSGDGTALFGASADSACAWIGDKPPMGLPSPKNTVAAEIHDVSEDANICVGFVTDAVTFVTLACRWDAQTPLVLPLGHAGLASTANGVSPDGLITVGDIAVEGVPGRRACHWRGVGSPLRLEIPNGSTVSAALSCSWRGLRTVGYVAGSPLGPQACIWENGRTFHDLKTVLESEFGLDLAGWTLSEAVGISDDGRTIVGEGGNPSGMSQPWVVIMPPPCQPDFNGDRVLNSGDFFEFVVSFFAGDAWADFNYDNSVNSQDFFDFLAAFFAGC